MFGPRYDFSNQLEGQVCIELHLTPSIIGIGWDGMTADEVSRTVVQYITIDTYRCQKTPTLHRSMDERGGVRIMKSLLFHGTQTEHIFVQESYGIR